MLMVVISQRIKQEMPENERSTEEAHQTCQPNTRGDGQTKDDEMTRQLVGKGVRGYI